LRFYNHFYRHFVKDGERKTTLDLGCGDGIVTAAIVEAGEPISVTLVDGSEDMLSRARERLAGLPDAKYIHANFQEILRAGRIGSMSENGPLV